MKKVSDYNKYFMNVYFLQIFNSVIKKIELLRYSFYSF